MYGPSTVSMGLRVEPKEKDEENGVAVHFGSVSHSPSSFVFQVGIFRFYLDRMTTLLETNIFIFSFWRLFHGAGALRLAEIMATPGPLVTSVLLAV